MLYHFLSAAHRSSFFHVSVLYHFLSQSGYYHYSSLWRICQEVIFQLLPIIAHYCRYSVPLLSLIQSEQLSPVTIRRGNCRGTVKARANRESEQRTNKGRSPNEARKVQRECKGLSAYPGEKKAFFFSESHTGAGVDNPERLSRMRYPRSELIQRAAGYCCEGGKIR